MGWLSTPMVEFGIKASDVIRNSNEDERTTSETSLVKKKEMKLNAALAGIRVYFELKSDDGFYVTFGQVCKNGVPVGDEYQTLAGWTPFTTDIDNSIATDLIQIYLRVEVGGTLAYVRNMRLCYSECVTKISGKELVTPLLDTEDPTISVTNQDPV